MTRRVRHLSVGCPLICPLRRVIYPLRLKILLIRRRYASTAADAAGARSVEGHDFEQEAAASAQSRGSPPVVVLYCSAMLGLLHLSKSIQHSEKMACHCSAAVLWSL